MFVANVIEHGRFISSDFKDFKDFFPNLASLLILSDGYQSTAKGASQRLHICLDSKSIDLKNLEAMDVSMLQHLKKNTRVKFMSVNIYSCVCNEECWHNLWHHQHRAKTNCESWKTYQTPLYSSSPSSSYTCRLANFHR